MAAWFVQLHDESQSIKVVSFGISQAFTVEKVYFLPSEGSRVVLSFKICTITNSCTVNKLIQYNW